MDESLECLAGLQMERLFVLQNYTDLLADLDHGMPVDVHFSLHCLVLATTMRNSR